MYGTMQRRAVSICGIAVALAATLACLCGPAQAQEPISATTQQSNVVSQTSAVLHGLIYTSGQGVSWQFQFGTRGRYTHGTPVETIPGGQTSPVGVSWTALHLRPGTRYQVRLWPMWARPR